MTHRFSNEKLLEILSLSQNATGIYTGEELIIQMANDVMIGFWGKDRSVIGKPLAEAVPELEGQPFVGLLQNVWRTGITYEAKDTPAELLVDGKLQTFYFDFAYRAIKNNSGEVECILHTAVDVTKLQHLNVSYQQSLQQLKLSEEMLNQFVQKIPASVAVYTGPDFTFKSINPAYERLLPNRKFIGRPMFEALPELVGTQIELALKHTYETGENFYERDMLVPVSEYEGGPTQDRYFTVSYLAHKDKTGNIAGLFGFALETTEQVKDRQETIQLNKDLAAANEELAAVNREQIIVNENLRQARIATEAERGRLYQFIMQAPAGICVLKGPDLIYELVNPGYQELLPGHQLIGRSVFEVLPEIVGTPIEQVLRSVYRTGQNEQMGELLVPLAQHEGGPIINRYFTYNFLPDHDTTGKISGVLGFIYEVTEQVNARQATEKLNRELKVSEESLRLSVEAARLGTYSVDLTSGIVTVNEYCREIFGLSPDYVFTAQAGLSMIEEDEGRISAAMNIAIENDTVFDEQYRIIRRNDNSMRWIRSVGRALKSDFNQTLLFHGILIDITEQKADEQRKNDFIGMVSHELKTPLTSMKGYIQMLQSKAKKSEDTFTAGVLDKAGNQVSKMTTMINGFLNVSRLESGKIHIDRQRFDLAELVKETEEESVASISSHQVVFAPVVETWVNADRDKIGQVINNLISNAVKYSDPNTIINVACVTRNGQAVVSVEDEGMGISPQDLPKLFERYYRVQAVKDTNVAGFGIGLYLCCEIIKRHDGDIWAESELGIGSVFHFKIPIVE